MGGASDGLYGASAYHMNDYSTTARKGWFFFDDEIVCLGAGIRSTLQLPINTTLNQTWLNGPVTRSDGAAAVTVPAGGDYTYPDKTRWIHHNQVGYYFPAETQVRLSTQAQSGSWKSVNTTQSADVITREVFKLWLDHGSTPANATYAYVVVPGKTAAEMAAYNPGYLSILANTPAVQAVRHSQLRMWQVIFYEAGRFEAEGIRLTADKPCVLLLKETDQATVTVVAADPTQQAASLTIGFGSAALPGGQELTLTLPQGPLAGSSVTGTFTAAVPPAMGGCSSVTLSDGQLLGRFLDRNVYVRVINGCWFASLSPGGEPVHVDWVKGVAETGGFAAGMKPFSRAVAEQCFKSNLAECMASWPTDCNQVQFTDGQLLGSFLDRNVYVRVINGCWFGSLSPTGQPVHVDWVKGVADRAGFAAGTQPFTRMLAEKCFKSNVSECGMAMSLREVAAELGGGLVLVPNPAGEQVQVQVPAGQEVRQVRIYSLSGTEVRRAAGGRVSLAGLAAGVYEVRVQTSGGRHYSGRLVKAGLGAH